LMSYSDRELGTLIEGMRSDGVLNNTILFITGDHGFDLNKGEVTHDIAKERVTERWVHVPLLVLAEGRLGRHKGTVVDIPAGHIDLMATIADMVGVPEGGFFQSGIGRSLLRDEESPKRVFTNIGNCYTAVLESHYKISVAVPELSQVAERDWVRVTNIAKDELEENDARNELDESLFISKRKDLAVKLTQYTFQATNANKHAPPKR
jgi:membrane-anchored protein YejM (alkaline phosphatase superfamily)